MSLKVDNKVNIAKVFTEKLSDLEKEFAIAVTDEVRNLKQRTRSGLTVEGDEMKQYSKEYASLKGGSGRSKRNTKSKRFFNSVSKSTRPDLTLSGIMLKSISSTVERVGNVLRAEVFFTSTKEEGKAQGKHKIRPFFDFSEKQRQSLFKVVQDFFKKI